MSRLGSFVLLLAGAAGCASLKAAPHPLYPGPARPPAELAVLTGPIAMVDDLDVSHLGPAFSVLPGCHVVVLREHLGEGSTGGAWSVTISRTVYAFDMVAGRSYDVEVRLQRGNSASVGNANVGGVKINAVEHDAGGRTLSSIAPLRKSAERGACTAAPAPEPAPEPPAPLDAG
jgi:hypothetical protein